ncbi:unnamed protein product, partial [Brenthis ino]
MQNSLSQRSSNQPDVDFLSIIDKTSINELKTSFRRSSNFISRTILDKVWRANSESLNERAIEHVVDSVKELLEESDINNAYNWNTTISFTDPIKLFEKVLPECKKCLNVEHTSVKNIKGNSCVCNTDILNIEKLDQYIKPLNSESNSQESKSGDELKPFKPKFRPKTKRNIPLSKNIQIRTSKENYENIPAIPKQSKEYDVDVEKLHVVNTDIDMIDENKAHKSQVAKITFKTAKEQLLASNPAARRTLGASRKAQAKFISPMLGAQEKQEVSEPIVTDERLKHIDPKMIELIESEIIDKGTPIGWDDIAGLQQAKCVIQEAVVWPLLRPDIFTGLRRPPRGVLLFGPPGTGKTLIGKCVAAQCRATFFSISASSLTSKWIGDGEKMVRALFAVARCHQPAVIFIDEIDSLLSQRSDTEHEASRRIKTEFLVQFDGAATGDEDRLLIVGATNRPQELDEAARRRLVKRLYVPLPDLDARRQIISNLLKNENHDLSPHQIAEIANLTDGYSGADMKSVCSEAAMGPIRSVPLSQIVTIDRDKVRSVNVQDFKIALQRVRPSVSPDDLGQYVKWNNTYGQGF